MTEPTEPEETGVGADGGVSPSGGAGQEAARHDSAASPAVAADEAVTSEFEAVTDPDPAPVPGASESEPAEPDPAGVPTPGVRGRARVGLIMGSDSDWSTMEAAAEALAEFDVPFEVGVVSAHRTPQRMLDYARGAAAAGIEVIIAGAGGAAHLPGMVASATPLPVIGVPVPLRTLDGMDSLLSIVQMPAGVPVATVSIGGARNAGLLAVRILGAGDPALRARMESFQRDLETMVLEKDAALRDLLLGGD